MNENSEHQNALLDAMKSSIKDGMGFEALSFCHQLDSKARLLLLEHLATQEACMLLSLWNDEESRKELQNHAQSEAQKKLLEHFFEEEQKREDESQEQTQLSFLLSLCEADVYRQGYRLMDAFYHQEQIFEHFEEEPSADELEMSALEVVEYFFEVLLESLVKAFENTSESL